MEPRYSTGESNEVSSDAAGAAGHVVLRLRHPYPANRHRQPAAAGSTVGVPALPAATRAGTTAEVREQDAAMAKIAANVQQKLGDTVTRWEHKGQGGRTLKIEPRVTELKFVGGGKRFFAGAMAGSSAVVMHVRLTDADTGKVIADPEFYQRAAAMGGAWSIGGTDNGMLVRISTVAQQYMQRNYASAVGGPTGLDGSEEE
jgi:hypothetical protein